MKKFLIILAVVLTNVFSVVATPINDYKINEEAVAHLIESNKNFKAFNDSLIMHENINFAPIYRYLELKDDQYEHFYRIHKDIYKSIVDLENKKEANVQTFKNHMNVDLRNSYYILDDEQYHKYLKVLNVTLVNKKLLNYLY